MGPPRVFHFHCRSHPGLPVLVSLLRSLFSIDDCWRRAKSQWNNKNHCLTCWAQFCDSQLIVFIFISTAFKHYHRIPIFHYLRYACHSQGVLPYINQPRTLSLRCPRPAVGKGVTLESSDWESKNIGLAVELRMPGWQTRGSILLNRVWCFTSAFGHFQCL